MDWNKRLPDSKVHGANMGPTWALSTPDGPHVGPMNLAFRAMLPFTALYATVTWTQLLGNRPWSVYCSGNRSLLDGIKLSPEPMLSPSLLIAPVAAAAAVDDDDDHHHHHHHHHNHHRHLHNHIKYIAKSATLQDGSRVIYNPERDIQKSPDTAWLESWQSNKSNCHNLIRI